MTTSKLLNRVSGPRNAPPPPPRTTCKLCRFAVRAGEPAVWLTKPMGLSHEACHVAGVLASDR